MLTGTTGDNYNRYTEMEMFVAEDDFPSLAADFAAYQDSVASQCATADCRATLHTGGRFVSQDDIWISGFYQRDTAVFSMVVHGTLTTEADPATVKLYDSGLQAAALKYNNARPHLGKNNYFTGAQMAAAFPKTYEPFAALRASLDPTRKFANDYLDQLFGAQ